jgi:hypothetical protein
VTPAAGSWCLENARYWLESLGETKHIEREVDRIDGDARESGLLADSCSLSNAQLVLARLHDFASWPKFVAHVEALGMANSPDAEFEAAANAVVTGDIAALTALLRTNPGRVRARSARERLLASTATRPAYPPGLCADVCGNLGSPRGHGADARPRRRSERQGR